VRKNGLAPWTTAALAIGLTKWFDGHGPWYFAASVGIAFILATIEVMYEKDYVDISVRNTYRLRFPKGRKFEEIVKGDFRLVQVHRREHPSMPGYWTVEMVFDGKEDK
jgi:hypothetical protein